MHMRKLNRTLPHRNCLMRNLATELVQHESIITTHAKAKETQKVVEHLITRAKKLAPLAKNGGQDYTTAFNRLSGDVYKHEQTIPKLLTTIAQRYASTDGGYTRILKLENRLGDCAPQSIIELVGGKRDMRATMTARVVARYESQNTPLNNLTQKNVQKICKTPEATAWFRAIVDDMKAEFYTEEKLAALPPLPEAEEVKSAPIELVQNPRLA